MKLLLLTTFITFGCGKHHTSEDAAASTVTVSTPTASEVTSNSLTLNWVAAKDSETASSKLSYLAFYTQTDPGNTHPTAATVKSDWTAVGTAQVAITSVSISNLSANTTYYFTVLVTNPANQTTVYPVRSQATLASEETTDTTTDTTPPAPGASGALTFTGSTTTGFTVEWTQATDDVSSASVLLYRVYSSTIASDVATLSAITATDSTAVLQGLVVGESSLALRELTTDTTYYVNVVVSDEFENKAVYTAGSTTTAQIPDTTPPVPQNTGILVFSNKTATGATVAWTAATDDRSNASTLLYEVYYSRTSSDVATLAAILDPDSTATSGGFITGDTHLVLTGLLSSAVYHVNVVVSDEEGNQSTYTAGSFITLCPSFDSDFTRGCFQNETEFD